MSFSHRAATAVAMLRFVLPFPPSVNRYYRNVGYRTLLSREAIASDGMVRTDWIIAWCCRQLGIPQLIFPEVYSRWREEVPDGLDAAVTHPHKQIPINRDEL